MSDNPIITEDGDDLVTEVPETIIFEADSTCLLPTAVCVKTCVLPPLIIRTNPPAVDSSCIPDGEIVMTLVSDTRTATLRGISEYVNPSVPPKKYLLQTLIGGLCYNDYGRNSDSTPCDSPLANSSRDEWGGTYVVDAATGIETNNLTHSTNPTGGTTDCALISVSPTTQPTLSFLDDGVVTPDYLGTISIAEDPDLIAWTYNGNPVILESQDEFGFPLYTCRVVTGEVRKTLTNEDTEEAAFSRATPVLGVSNVAVSELRGAGVFTFERTVITVDLACTGLAVGVSYRATVAIVTADIGGGNPVSSDLTYDFTAASATEEINDVIVSEPGKQITVGSYGLALA